MNGGGTERGSGSFVTSLLSSCRSASLSLRSFRSPAFGLAYGVNGNRNGMTRGKSDGDRAVGDSRQQAKDSCTGYICLGSYSSRSLCSSVLPVLASSSLSPSLRRRLRSVSWRM